MDKIERFCFDCVHYFGNCTVSQSIVQFCRINLYATKFCYCRRTVITYGILMRCHCPAYYITVIKTMEHHYGILMRCHCPAYYINEFKTMAQHYGILMRCHCPAYYINEFKTMAQHYGILMRCHCPAYYINEFKTMEHHYGILMRCHCPAYYITDINAIFLILYTSNTLNQMIVKIE